VILNWNDQSPSLVSS